MAASRLGEVRMGSRWRDLRFTDQPCCMREWQLLYRLASVRDGSVRSGGQGRKPIGRRPQLTRQEMRPMRGCRIRGIRSYTTTSAAITSLRWNCSALQCTRYHTSRICARCFWGDVFGRPIPDDSPSFFRDSLVQVVARTYLLSREISMVQSLRQWQVAVGGSGI